MALQDDIGALIASAQTLVTTYNTRAAAINQAVTDAIAAVPELDKTWFVGPTGTNANAGTTAAAPLATIAEAVRRTPSGGMCTVRLMADHTLVDDVSITNKLVRIQSDVTGVMRSLTHQAYARDVNGVQTRTVAGFRLGSRAAVTFSGIRTVIPSMTAALAGLPIDSFSFPFSYFAGFSTMVSLTWQSGEIVLPADRVAPLIRAFNVPTSLYIASTTTPVSLNGALFESVTASGGTATSTLPWLVTNLATI